MDRPVIVGMVEALLAQAFGQPVTVTAWERIQVDVGGHRHAWAVARCALAGGSGLPPWVAVKWRRDGRRGREGMQPDPIGAECAALTFLSGLPGPALAPRPISADPNNGLLVMEDLHPRRPLFELLGGAESPAAARGLESYARTLAELAVATVGRAEQWARQRRAAGLPGPGLRCWDAFSTVYKGAREAADAVGAAPSPAAETEMAGVVEVLASPGPFLALSNGDVGENNFLVLGDDGRLIDFEDARYQHALLDGASLHSPGPRWITLPDPAPSGLEDVYRSTLAVGIPEAADDRIYGAALAAAAMALAIPRVGPRLAMVDARPPGHGSRPQLITTLEYAARVAARHGAVPHLAAWCQELARSLRRRWPDADARLQALSGDRALWVRRG